MVEESWRRNPGGILEEAHGGGAWKRNHVWGGFTPLTAKAVVARVDPPQAMKECCCSCVGGGNHPPRSSGVVAAGGGRPPPRSISVLLLWVVDPRWFVLEAAHNFETSPARSSCPEFQLRHAVQLSSEGLWALLLRAAGGKPPPGSSWELLLLGEGLPWLLLLGG